MSIGFPRANVYNDPSQPSASAFVTSQIPQIFAMGFPITDPPIQSSYDLYTQYKLTNDNNYASSAWSDWQNLTKGQLNDNIDINFPAGWRFEVGYLPDGRAQIFWIDWNGVVRTVWNNEQGTGVSTPTWSGVQQLTADQSFASGQLLAGYRADNTLQLFVLTQAGVIYTNANTPGASWTGWQRLTSLIGAAPTTFCIGYLPDLSIQLFIGTEDKQVFWTGQTSADPTLPPTESWSDLQQVTTSSVAMTTSAIGYVPDGRLQLFSIGLDGIMYSARQKTTDPTAGWDWGNLTVPSANVGIAQYSLITIGYQHGGGIQIYVQGTDKFIYSLYQRASDPNGSYPVSANWVWLGKIGTNGCDDPTGSLLFGYRPNATMLLGRLGPWSKLPPSTGKPLSADYVGTIYQNSYSPTDWQSDWTLSDKYFAPMSFVLGYRYAPIFLSIRNPLWSFILRIFQLLFGGR